MSEEKPAEEGHEKAKPKGKKKLIIIILVALLVVGGGAGAFLTLGKKAPEKEEETHEEEDPSLHYMTAKLDTFIVNLGQTGSFLKVTLLLQYDPAILTKVLSGGHGGEGHGGGGSGGGGEGGEGALPAGLKEKEAIIRDAVIRVLSAKRQEEVLSAEGKEQLKEELIEGINESLGYEEGPIVGIFFTDFLVQ